MLYKGNVFCFDQILINLVRTFEEHREKAFNSPFFLKVDTDHLLFIFDNLESGKRNYCFGKKVWNKFLNFASKKQYEPCYILQVQTPPPG